MDERDYTCEAEALFNRFANKHGLIYEVETGVPMDVCWKFPAQPKLSMPLTLGLQNSDELNFGVWDLWSYFFPFEKVSQNFERILDAWVAGDARVLVLRGRARLLQVRERENWKTVYRADGVLFLFRRFARAIVRNGDTERELEQRGVTRRSGGSPAWGCLGLVYASGAALFAAISGKWIDFAMLLLLALILFPLFAFGARRVNRIDYSIR
jgi:hypothetical protein